METRKPMCLPLQRSHASIKKVVEIFIINHNIACYMRTKLIVHQGRVVFIDESKLKLTVITLLLSPGAGNGTVNCNELAKTQLK